MSSPAVAERIKRLEESGVIAGYTLALDARALGYELMAMVRIRPLPGKLKALERLIQEIPEVMECDKVTGEDCFIARLALENIGELDAILDRITDLAETNSSIVKSSPVKRRLPPLRAGRA